jgi:outer membrane receptor for ferrienterochelin and colicin
VTLDGVDYNDAFFGGSSGGGFVNVVTKSGGNDFYGSAFYYNRPQDTTAKFANGTDPRDQKTQQFGASIGGPILHDRLFFFGAWDQQRQSTTIPITSALVTDPDIAAR